MKLKPANRNGSALLMALAISVTFIAFGATMFNIVQRRYRSFHQTASWQEALLSAEAGVDIAMSEIRETLSDPATAWSGWLAEEDGSAVNPTATTVYYSSTVLLRTSEGGQRSWAEITVDAPPEMRDETGEQWYRIRSLGIAEVPGGGVVAGDRLDTSLRKLDLRTDRRTGDRVMKARATRLIEAIAKPVGTFSVALLSAGSINMTSQNIVVDSYDSRDATKSTNGSYDPDKRQKNGAIATNGPFTIDAGSAHIYGDVKTNGGTVMGASNVTGQIRTDFYQEILPVVRPDTSPDPGTPYFISDSATLAAKADVPARFLFSSLKLSGSGVLRVQGAADGSDTFAEIVVTGDIELKGQSQIVVDPGVYLRVFIVGNADFGGQGVANQSGKTTRLQLYGVSRPPVNGVTPAKGTIKIAGNGGFTGALYAPDYDISMVGGGNSDSIFGAFVGNTVSMSGVQAVHYDEALADGGLIGDYRIVSWFEDIR